MSERKTEEQADLIKEAEMLWKHDDICWVESQRSFNGSHYLVVIGSEEERRIFIEHFRARFKKAAPGN